MHIKERKFLKEIRKTSCIGYFSHYNGFQVEANEAFKMKGTNVVITMQDGKRVNSTLKGITLTQDGYLVIKGFSAGYKVKMSSVESVEISR